MGSSSSDHDSYMKVDDSELFEEYDDSVWHDKDCWRPFEEAIGVSGSKLCLACQSLFSGYKETQTFYRHYYRLAALQSTAERGCQLCILVRSKVDRETKNHSPCEVLRLTFVIYQADLKDGITTFELWFHFLRACKGLRYGDVVWGIKTIDFVLSDGKLQLHSTSIWYNFRNRTSTTDISCVFQMSMRLSSVATRLHQILSPRKIVFLRTDG